MTPLFAALLIIAQLSSASAARTVIGPGNIDLQDGANALLAGDWETGVRLTLRGLDTATGPRERKIAHANLCAGYLMVEQLGKALEHCDWVLERYDTHWRTYNNRALVYLRLERYAESAEDIRRGQALRPNSIKLKTTRSMLRDAARSVEPEPRD